MNRLWIAALSMFMACALSSAAVGQKKPSEKPEAVAPVTGVHKTEQRSDVVKVTESVSQEGCADASKLKDICYAIQMKLSAKDLPENSPIYFRYEKQIYDAACVTPQDSEEVTADKIRKMWSKLEDKHLTCDSHHFDVSHGSILKFALVYRNLSLIEWAAFAWKVNLNKIDRNDNRTLLDYLKVQIEYYKNDKRYHEQLSELYRHLRKAGAKHRSEL